MLKLISKLTESNNKIYNLIVLITLFFIAICIICVLGKMIFTTVQYYYNI